MTRSRAILSFLDQLISSGTNFVLLFAVVHSVDIRSVGAFSIAYALFFVALVAAKGLAVEPLLVRRSSDEVSSWRRSTGLATGQTVVVGLTCGLLTSVIGISLGGSLAQAFVPLGIFLPALLLQDAWRFVLLAERRPGAACLNDTLRLATMIALFGILATLGHQALSSFVGAWGLAASVSALVGAWQAGVVPQVRGAVAWFQEHRDISLGFAGDYLVQRGSQQAALVLIGAVGGLAAVGAIGAARLLFAPLTTVQSALNVAAIAEAARLRTRAPLELGRFATLVGTGMATAVVMVGVALLALPDSVGRFVLADAWGDARPMILPMTVLTAATAAGGGFWVVLRVLEAAKATFLLRSGFGLLTVATASLGTWLAGAAGGAWGLAASAVLLAGAMAAAAMHRIRTQGLTPDHFAVGRALSGQGPGAPP